MGSPNQFGVLTAFLYHLHRVPFLKNSRRTSFSSPRIDFPVVSTISSFVTDPEQAHLPIANRKSSANLLLLFALSRKENDIDASSAFSNTSAYPKTGSRGELRSGALVAKTIMRGIVAEMVIEIEEAVLTLELPIPGLLPRFCTKFSHKPRSQMGHRWRVDNTTGSVSSACQRGWPEDVFNSLASYGEPRYGRSVITRTSQIA